MARRKRLVLVCRPLPRSFALAAVAFLAAFSTGARLASSADIAWLGDPAVATRQAREQGKLLIVVHFSEDFSRRGDASRLRNAYAAVTLSDKRCRELLDSHFVLCCRNVGYPATISATLPGKGEPKVEGAEHAITYFTTADGRVLHFVSGFVSSETFLKEARWALDCNADALRFPPEEQRQAVRENHLDSLPKDNVMALLTVLRRDPKSRDITGLLRAAQKEREQQLLGRLGKNLVPVEETLLMSALATHGEVEADQGHVVLAEVPLVPLPELERPAWTILSGQRFWQDSPRREELCRWLHAKLAGGKPVLLVVKRDEPLSEVGKPVADRVAWPPQSGTIKRLLPKVEVEQVSLDELAALIADCRLTRVSSKVSSPPRFVVLWLGGARQDVTSEHDGYTGLGKVLAAATQTTPTKLSEVLEGAENEVP